MEDKNITVPFIVYESEMTRAERRHRRSFILVLVLIAALLLSNLGWLYAWMQYDYVDSGDEIAVDAGSRGVVNYIGNDGDITNGKDSNP